MVVASVAFLFYFWFWFGIYIYEKGKNIFGQKVNGVGHSVLYIYVSIYILTKGTRAKITHC